MVKRHQILVVDDDSEILLVTKMSLKRAKYQGGRFKITTASSGEEALETMRQNPEFAVVVIDQIMESDTAGLQTCRRIRSELGQQRPRLILRSGLTDEMPKNRKGYEGLDLTAVLPKGEMTPAGLVQTVSAALDEYYAQS